jgi:hypothetical protein
LDFSFLGKLNMHACLQEVKKYMLFVEYWELNPNFEPKKLAEAASKLLEKGEWPVPGIKLVGWYITPEYWGVTIFEAESEEAMLKDAIAWRAAVPGIFKVVKMATAMPAENVLPLVLK